ncbi:ATP-binding protein [Saccharopolyspora sp. K220]|uniref:sensor histidine kinase n=1 Tax=Saccharopolyspora soli TaxID=2926618 RepID=UPI001F56E5B8|nr:ATP-binding protein [Saccharopolyspora soli]MCI2417933.1 ATP-binding protein [Saccharopolyspora soli]
MRAKTVALLVVPVVSLMALWALATVSAVQSAWTLHQVKELNAELTRPVSDLVDDLQAERAAVAQYLAAPRGGEQLVSGQRARTAAATAALVEGSTVARANIANVAPEVDQRISALVEDLDRLQRDHAEVVAQRMDWNDAYNSYTTAIERAFAVDEALTNVQDGEAAAAARVVLQLGRVGEMIARQDAVVTSALAAQGMTPDQHEAFATALGGQHVLTDGLLPDLAPADQAAYQQFVNDGSYRSLTSMQNALLSGPAAVGAFSVDQWRGAVQPLAQSVATVRANASAATAAQAESASGAVLTQAALTVALGLLAVLLALVVSVRIGRGMVIELVGLRDSALELANRRLPQAMRRLRAGEKIDIDADVPVVAPGEGEIGQVGNALNAVQHAALQAAAERAELLTGVSGVFVNLARRNQSLVHRQLSLLDAMERRTEDPTALEDLFRLDHLATRMRRHAEGLIIMSGAAPGRSWRNPVPLMDLVRSAVSEVEDYERVEVHRMSELYVVGSAVSDLTHLFSELVENATSFSPPGSTVLVHGEPVGTGFVVEIEDRGLGMRPERMDEANRLIADSHRLELFESDRLGLFVVSRLANRQHISVSLRRSPYGGTTAVVLLPASILTTIEPRPDQHDQQPEAISAPEEDVVPVPMKAVATRLPTRVPQASAVPRATRRRRSSIWRDPAEPVAINGEVVSHETPADTGGNDEQNTGGLPRRTRQASLAPGLRAEDSRNQRKTDAVGAKISPEQARSMMTAVQQGFARGRGARTDDFPDA